MSNNDDYNKVHKVFIKDINFELLVLEIPTDELEDKLAYLAQEKGNINKVFYEDYIIAICIANINQLLYCLNDGVSSEADMLDIRAAVVKNVVKFNPLLNPDKLVINKNHVIKNLGRRRKLVEGEVILSNNKHWDSPSVLTDISDNSVVRDADVVTNEIRDIDDLEYESVKKWWKRIGQYVTVKKFNPSDAESILKQRYFHNRTSFATFVVSVCIEDFAELFSMLDEMGVPNRVAPPLLIHELNELCKACNDFLTFENSQKYFDDGDKKDGDSCDGKCSSGGSKSNTMSKYAKDKDGKTVEKKKFKDIPRQDLLKLGDNMKVFLIGQDKAIESLTNAIQRASVGLKDPNKPIGSFLLAGRTGVGKTLATKVLADELIKGKGNNLITIDCSEYSADHEYAKLIGSPSGYVGHEAGGFLTNAVNEDPFSVVVFDEVEKASKKVHELLLQILEEGRLTDGKGKTVSFKDSVIIMTSNVGVSEVDSVRKTIGFGDVAKLTDDKKEKAIDDAIKKKFKPEFINRIDEIIHFNTLNEDDYMRIIDIELYKLNDNLRNNDTDYKDLQLTFDAKVKSFIYADGIDADFGARPLKRCIEREIATPLAKQLLTSDPAKVDKVKVTNTKKGPKFNLIEKKVKQVKAESEREVGKDSVS